MAKTHNHYAGASAEYLTAAWFLDRGYQVWWPSVQQDTTDFIVTKDGQHQRVQVKKATWVRGRRPSSPNEYLQVHTIGDRAYAKEDFDILIAVDAPRLWMIPFADIKGRQTLKLDKRGGGRMINNTLDYSPDKWRIA